MATTSRNSNTRSDSLEDTTELNPGPPGGIPSASTDTQHPRRVRYADLDDAALADEEVPGRSPVQGISHDSGSLQGDEKHKYSASASRSAEFGASMDTPNQSSGDDDSHEQLDFNGGYKSSAESGTHSSGSSGTFNNLSRSGLPCGVTMTQVMCALILVPIIFLVTYTAIPLDAAVDAENYINDHRSMINTILNLAARLQAERRYSATFVAANASTTTADKAHDLLVILRPFITDDFLSLYKSTIGDDRAAEMEYAIDFATRVRAIGTDLTKLQQRVDDRTLDAPTIRTEMLKMIERVYALMMVIAKDRRAENMEKKLLVFMVMRRIQNSLTLMQSLMLGLMTREGYDAINLREIHGIKMSVERDIIAVDAAGDTQAVLDLNRWRTNADTISFFALLDQMLAGDATFWASIDQRAFGLTADAMIVAMNQQDNELLDAIVKDLKKDALTEGMMMLGAVLACIIAAALVAWLNYREQKRMESALRATRNLAAAVQRFVPRNQLKTMGVRSITQVTSGLQVEVAQTMLFSDIRDFTGLSEQMKNIELFEWLQSYVSRMTKVTVAEKGYVDKFIGDALFCVFPQPTNGMNAAIRMHVSTDQLNLELVAQKHTKMVAIGVGLHYGVVVAGVFGDSTRLSCTMVASDVNLASRLEALTKSFGAKIIASEAVISQVDASAYDMRPLGKVQVSGSTKAIAIYDVFQNDAIAVKNYKHSTLHDFTRAVELADRDPSAASPTFNRLAARARACGLIDVAAEKKCTAATVSPHNSVLEFEKNGDVRSPSALNLPGHHASSGNGLLSPMSSRREDAALPHATTQ